MAGYMEKQNEQYSAFYNALVSAGVNEKLATAAANDVAPTEQVATKLDLANMQTSLANMHASIANMETRLVKWMFGINLGVVGLAVAIIKLT